MISQNFQDEVWNKLNSIERRLSLTGGGGFAPSNAEFVVMSLNGSLTQERVLAAGVGLLLVDGGAGGAATFNVDVGIADDDIVQIDSVGVANDDYAKFTANGLEGRNYAEVLSDLSGRALAAFDFNSQNLTRIGTIGCGVVSSGPDTDISSTFGRARIGHLPTVIDFALFSHIDRHNVNNYALIQGPDGDTFLNASPNRQIYFRINNATVIRVDNRYISLMTGTAPVASLANSFRFYSADIVAGNAAPHFRTENDDIIKLYKYVDADFGNAINSGDPDTDDAISAIISALTAHGLIAAA